MKLEDYRRDLLQEIRATAIAEGISERAAFVSEVASILEDAEELSDFREAYFEMTGPKGKRIQIDGYSYNELDECLTIVSCDFQGNDELETITETDYKKFFSRAENFITESFSGYIRKNGAESSLGYSISMDVADLYANVAKYRFMIFSDRQMSKKIKDIKASEINGKASEYSIWDISRLYALKLSAFDKEDIVIDLKEFSKSGIPCLQANKTSDYTAYLCNIPGKILGDLYNRFGSRLLEGNVRSFLSTKGKVNKGIRWTILNAPEMFFAYNNGIAATASGIKIEKVDNVPFISEITGLQIVNGGQTTASLASALFNDRDKANDLANIFVPMKLSIVSEEKSQELIPNISRYANTQNKVSDADFFSNHPFHVRMEDFSRRVLAPAVGGNQYATKWYYERAKGQYKQETFKKSQAEAKKFQLECPKSQMFTKIDFAKYINLCRMMPDVASKGSQKNFLEFAKWIDSEWEKSDTQFNENFFKQAVACAILFKSTDRIVKNLKICETGYKANVIYYSIAKMFHMIKEQGNDHKFNFKAVWQKQAISKTTENQLVDIIHKVYGILTDESRGMQNVTEWAKRPACWEQVQKYYIEISDGFLGELVDPYTVENETKAAKREQKSINKLQAPIEVANYGQSAWNELLQWGKENRLVTPFEEDFLCVAANMNKKFPSDKQCVKILEIREKLRMEGYAK